MVCVMRVESYATVWSLATISFRNIGVERWTAISTWGTGTMNRIRTASLGLTRAGAVDCPVTLRSVTMPMLPIPPALRLLYLRVFVQLMRFCSFLFVFGCCGGGNRSYASMTCGRPMQDPTRKADAMPCNVFSQV